VQSAFIINDEKQRVLYNVLNGVFPPEIEVYAAQCHLKEVRKMVND